MSQLSKAFPHYLKKKTTTIIPVAIFIINFAQLWEFQKLFIVLKYSSKIGTMNNSFVHLRNCLQTSNCNHRKIIVKMIHNNKEGKKDKEQNILPSVCKLFIHTDLSPLLRQQIPINYLNSIPLHSCSYKHRNQPLANS